MAWHAPRERGLTVWHGMSSSTSMGNGKEGWQACHPELCAGWLKVQRPRLPLFICVPAPRVPAPRVS